MNVRTEAAGAGPFPNRVPSLRSYIDPAVVRRAVVVAIVLGSILTLVNQAGALFGDREFKLLPWVLVYATPFVVVLLSQTLGIRQAVRDGAPSASRDLSTESFFFTAFSHGIPVRAVLVGLLVGGIDAVIVSTATYLEHGHLNGLPLALMAQAFSLPILFGLLSQALAYRRAISRLRASAPQAVVYFGEPT